MMSRLRGSWRSGFRLRALASILALGFFAAPILGCSVFNKDEDLVPEQAADKVYNEGLFLLNNKKDYEDAARKFDQVERQNPYSEWARKALPANRTPAGSKKRSHFAPGPSAAAGAGV